MISRHRLPGSNLPRRQSLARKLRRAAFSLTEVTVSLSISAVVLGMLMVGAISMRRGLHSNQTYTEAYSDQRRITDYLGRDLRRAVGLAYTDEAGQRVEATSPASVIISERATLVLTLPGYYRSDDRGRDDYDAPLEVVSGENRLDYGTSEGLAPTVEVVYRKLKVAGEDSVCYVREEGGREEVIIRRAEQLFVQVDVGAKGHSGNIKTWFRSRDLGPAPLVSTHDQLLLRNPPLGYRP
jgi:hypothetical protein